MVSSLDSSRLEMMAKVQKYLSTIPVRKAWVFGSFARGEETPESDLDLLVDYMTDAKLSLLDVIRYKRQLESIIGREVDLVENGYLKPFAVSSAERDKYLIYER
ncbi:MAG: nucleotidyltransferase domain-containing protein [Bacteroidales bacterium]|nr:nucleotidyltransferase domain-containing protein [Bacteroidales bacterium]